MSKQWDAITVKELFVASHKESRECLELARHALHRKDELSSKALKDRSDKHGQFHYEVKVFIDNPEDATVRTLLDAIEAHRLACLDLESLANQYNQPIFENAFRRQGNHYEWLYQEIMYFVNKIESKTV